MGDKTLKVLLNTLMLTVAVTIPALIWNSTAGETSTWSPPNPETQWLKVRAMRERGREEAIKFFADLKDRQGYMGWEIYQRHRFDYLD